MPSPVESRGGRRAPRRDPAGGGGGGGGSGQSSSLASGGSAEPRLAAAVPLYPGLAGCAIYVGVEPHGSSGGSDKLGLEHKKAGSDGVTGMAARARLRELVAKHKETERQNMIKNERHGEPSKYGIRIRACQCHACMHFIQDTDLNL